MAIDEHIREVAAASNGVADAARDSGFAYCKEGITSREHAAKGDEGSEDFEELDDLEVVDMNGGAIMKTLPDETDVHGHCRDEGQLEGDSMEAMNPEIPLDLTERASHSHLSASATPDKAMQFDITQRILILHEHLKKSNHPQGAVDIAGRVEKCARVEDISHVLLDVVKQGFESHPAFDLWSNQDRSDWEMRCIRCTSMEGMADMLIELEQQLGVQVPGEDDTTLQEESGGPEAEDTMKAECEGDPVVEEAHVEEQAPTTTSRFGRVRAVPNFARMVDPLAQRAGNADAPAPRAPPSNGGADDVQATATQNMIELVKVIVSKVPKAGNPSSGAVGALPQGQDKYVGVRIKQNGYGAVIKKNHSEINLGTFATPEEAARAYDMAALICQGDRAKVNFLDSWDIVQQYDTSAIREPFRDHHKDSREHMAAVHAARHHHATGCNLQPEFTPMTYESTDTTKPSSLGRLLNDFSDRFPYAAVRDLDPAIWEVFTERNCTLSSFSEFGSQLLWLSSQVTDAAMQDSWGMHQHVFEHGCRNSHQGEKCIELLKKFDQLGVDWDKVGSLWEIDDGEGGDSGKRGCMKRKRGSEGEGRERIEDFLSLNWHILSAYERENAKALPLGIEPTLNLMRAKLQVQKHAIDERPRKLSAAIPAQKQESAARPGRPAANNARFVVDRRAGSSREREKEKEAVAVTTPVNSSTAATSGSSKSKGMTCRFCGKVFTHAPAHLQHERAHLQQQETKNPASRIFQHMAPGATPTKGSLRNAGRTEASLPCDHSDDGEMVADPDAPSGSGAGHVKLEMDDCLVDPPRQDGLDEPNSRIDDDDLPNHEDDEIEAVGVEDDDDEGEDGGTPLSNGPEAIEGTVPGSLVCGSKACVDQGIPCPPCAEQNKGIAACFAQGHLFLTDGGEVPSSCKDCKQRNKGALFCFKRGHMDGLRAMLPPTIAPVGMPLASADAVALEDDGVSEDVAVDADGMDVQPLSGDADDDLSGPVSPADEECSL